MKYIQIEIDEYIDMLEQRKNFVETNYDWRRVPDIIWEDFIETIRNCGADPNHSSPSYVVDNLIVNGEWYDWDELKQDDETDEEFESRMEYEGYTISVHERLVWR